MVIGLTRIFEVVEVLKLASSTNLFGLGCPFYCGPSSFSSFALALIIGVFLAFPLCLALGFYLFRFLRPGWLPQNSSSDSIGRPRPAHLRISGVQFMSQGQDLAFRVQLLEEQELTRQLIGPLRWVLDPTLWCPGLLHRPDLRRCLREAGLSPRWVIATAWLLKSVLCQADAVSAQKDVGYLSP